MYMYMYMYVPAMFNMVLIVHPVSRLYKVLNFIVVAKGFSWIPAKVGRKCRKKSWIYTRGKE